MRGSRESGVFNVPELLWSMAANLCAYAIFTNPMVSGMALAADYL
jgi:hypothetical protein